MKDVVPIGTPFGAETLIEFLEREGPIATCSIAGRFGWTSEQAIQHLSTLHMLGHIEGEAGIWTRAHRNTQGKGLTLIEGGNKPPRA